MGGLGFLFYIYSLGCGRVFNLENSSKSTPAIIQNVLCLPVSLSRKYPIAAQVWLIESYFAYFGRFPTKFVKKN